MDITKQEEQISKDFDEKHKNGKGNGERLFVTGYLKIIVHSIFLIFCFLAPSLSRSKTNNLCFY
jgi:hypothetical protein